MNPTCDMCGCEITEDNRGQATEEGVLCADCLEECLGDE